MVAHNKGSRGGLRLLDPARRLHALRGAVGALPLAVRRPMHGTMRFAAARLCDLVDTFETLTGRRDPLRPPRRKIFVGSNSIIKSDYHEIGRELVALVTRFAGLGPNDAILEIGSGTGRIAASLSGVLSEKGRFEGFEIVREGVAWCQANITPRFPNISFQHANLYNSFYNPEGTETAATFRFPYDDASFDLVIATSVFTHLHRPDAAHYLAETARVLRPGGRSFITHFLLTEAAHEAVAAGRCALAFAHSVTDGLTVDPINPEAAITIDADAVCADYLAAGLDVREPVAVGRWCGHTDGVHFQDLVVADKR